MSDGTENINIDDVASGQKIVIYAIIANFLVSAMARSAPELGIVITVAAIAVVLGTFCGVYRLSRGLGDSLGMTIALLVLSIIPLLNLIILLILNFKATKQLRKAGFEVGLLGVR